MNSGEDSAFPINSSLCSASHEYDSKLSRSLGSSPVRGLCIATWQYSSLWVSAVVLTLGGFDIVEVDVQDREQVDSGEKVEAREKERKEEDKTRTNNQRSNT